MTTLRAKIAIAGVLIGLALLTATTGLAAQQWAPAGASPQISPRTTMHEATPEAADAEMTEQMQQMMEQCTQMMEMMSMMMGMMSGEGMEGMEGMDDMAPAAATPQP